MDISMKPIALPPFQTSFPPEEFAARRQRVAQAIGVDAVAVIQGADLTGAFDAFRQTNEMFYLTGVEVPQAYLLIHGKDARAVLYLPERDEKLEKSDGPQLNCDNVDAVTFLTGIESVRSRLALKDDLATTHRILTPFSPSEGRQSCRDTLLHCQKAQAANPWRLHGSREDLFREKLKSLRPTAELGDLSPVLDRLRLIKSPREIQILRRTGHLTGLAVREAMHATRPGLYEYHLAAVADFVFQLNGSRPGGGYRPIAASGKNIWNAHYYQNSAQLSDGDWVLLDFAPDCANYTSDIGRYWPVGGRYSPWQRELYSFIVTYHKTLLELIRPGILPDVIMDEAAARMEPIVRSTRWSKASFEQAAQQTLRFRGHLSHPVGMAVHDVGSYMREPFKPGLVFALDPQMWVPSEELYVRVEDTVVVTEEGVEVLTTGAPLELDDVEALMNRPRQGTLIAKIESSDDFLSVTHA